MATRWSVTFTDMFPGRGLLVVASVDGGPVRVTIVAETFSPAVNGVVNSVRRVVDELTQRGHTPTIIAPSGESYRSHNGQPVRVDVVPSMTLPGYRGLAVAKPSPDVRALLEASRPDVVHLASPVVLGRAAALAAQELAVPSVAVFQTDLAAFARRYRVGPSARLVWSYLRRVHALADLTLAPSSAAAYQLRSQGIGPLALWSRGVDSVRFHPARRDEAWRRAVAGRDMVVGFVGRLAPEKRVELLAPASELPGVQLVVVGDGPRRRSLERAMPGAVFTGQLTGAELTRAMASLDLLVHPGADETFCQVVQEALSCAVPVIATAAGGPLDLVRHGENGLLWSGENPDLLAAQVAELRDEPAQVARLSSAARPSVAWRTWSLVTDTLLEHYRRVMATRQRPIRIAS